MFSATAIVNQLLAAVVRTWLTDAAYRCVLDMSSSVNEKTVSTVELFTTLSTFKLVSVGLIFVIMCPAHVLSQLVSKHKFLSTVLTGVLFVILIV